MKRTPSCPAARRGGFTMIELLVSATLLMSIISLGATLSVQSGRLWQECRYQRLGLDELSGQLDRLTSLDQDQRAAALAELVPSEPILAALPNAQLTSEIITDRDGTRLILRLAWDRLGGSKQIVLVGWIDPLPASAADLGQQTAEPEPEEQTP
jgi:hypothetical protein